MGTSSSYNGVSGNTNLLPTGWLDDNIIADLIGPKNNGESYTQNEKDNAISKWKRNISKTKGKFTRSYNKRSNSSIKGALSSYKNVYGGNSGYIKHLTSYQKSIADVGIALSNLSESGTSDFSYLGIDIQGKSTEEILLMISSTISPTGDTKGNTIIREAIILTLNDLDNVEVINGKSNIDLDLYNDIMRQYLSNLILSDVLTFMGTNLYKLLPSQRKEYEEELKNCIDISVFNEFRDYDFNLNLNESTENVREILDDIIDKLAKMFDEGESDD